MAEDLVSQLELPQCECLNASSKHTLRDCIEVGSRDEADRFLQSDCDEEVSSEE